MDVVVGGLQLRMPSPIGKDVEEGEHALCELSQFVVAQLST